ncbi:MAG: CBS and ACT domain-containing protein [Syntrophobacterales bacterium]|nr:CBS and ACT domain-containing protein [Syntrophobacterales bacterium]
MYVGWHMVTDLVTISPDTPIIKAREIMNKHRISHLPVTDGERHLLGLVTDRDLREAWASPATTLSVYELTYILQKITVESIMKKKVITVTEDTTIERAAFIMHQEKIGCLPVVSGGKLVGMLTTADLMSVLLAAMGMSDDSGRITILSEERMGILSHITSIIKDNAINIKSILIHPLPRHDKVWQILLRFRKEDIDKAAQVLMESGYKVLKEYVKDLTPYLP